MRLFESKAVNRLKEAQNIITNPYIRVHGKHPKGFGLWAFGDKDGNVLEMIKGNLTDASKEAKKRLPNMQDIYVLG